MTPQEKIKASLPNLQFEIPEELFQQSKVAQLMAQIAKALGPSKAHMEAISEALKLHEETLEKIKLLMEHVKEASQPISAAIERWHNFGPLVYVPVSVDNNGGRDHLDADTDEYGFFMIGGVKLSVLHSRTSRTGRFLFKLLLSKSKIVPYSEIQEFIGAGDRRKTFRDLKYNLKRIGYKLDYELVRGEGIALKGICPI